MRGQLALQRPVWEVTSLARLRLVARGDADAFDAVYDLLAPSVFGIVRRVVRDRA